MWKAKLRSCWWMKHWKLRSIRSRCRCVGARGNVPLQFQSKLESHGRRWKVRLKDNAKSFRGKENFRRRCQRGHHALIDNDTKMLRRLANNLLLDLINNSSTTLNLFCFRNHLMARNFVVDFGGASGVFERDEARRKSHKFSINVKQKSARWRANFRHKLHRFN